MVVRPGESIGTNQVDTIRELEPTEFDVLMKAIEYLSTARRNYAASSAGCGAPNFASSFVFVYVH